MLILSQYLLFTVGHGRTVSGHTHLSVGTDVLLRNISHNNLMCCLGKWLDNSTELSSSLTFLPARITVLNLAQTLLGEDDELALVLLKPGNIPVERISALVGPTVVNGNSNSPCVLCGQAGSLQFLKGETLSKPDLSRIALGRAMNSRAKEFERAGSDGSGLVGTRKTTRLLLASLVQ
jgi:hypothetical protein